MPEHDPMLDAIAAGDLVVTEEGVLTAEDLAAREGAGAGLAPELVTEEQLAEQALDEQLQQAFDAPWQTFGERALGASTFGMTDVARGEESAYEARRRQIYNPSAATAGELAGAVAPALLSGGAGVMGTAARLTPMGRLSAATGRLAARGGLGKAMAGGVIEGVAQAGGDYISRVSLDENASFSGEALASALLAGGVLGGAGGAAGRGLERLAGAGARRLTARADDALAATGKRADEAGLATLLEGKRPTTWSSYRGVVRRRLRDTDAAQARALGEAIETAASRRIASEADDILSSGGWRAVREADEAAATGLEQALRAAADDATSAAAEARAWWSRYSEAVDLQGAKSKLTRDAGDELEEEGVQLLARLDEARFRLDDHLSEASARAGVPRASADVADEATQAAGRTLRDRAGDMLGGVRRPVEAVLGVGELARDVGVETGLPSVRDIPVVGQAMGLYLRFKGASAAARGLSGRLPSTKATRAAERVVSVDEAIASRVAGLLAKGARAAALSSAPRVTAKAVAQQARDVVAADPSAESAGVWSELGDTTSGVQEAASASAARAISYLAKHAPRDPLPARLPGQPQWEPTPQQVRDWDRRTRAVTDPLSAIGAVMDGPGSAIELQVLREVHPEHWRLAQAELAERLPELAAKLPRAKLLGIARAFGLPASAAQMPAYPRPMPSAVQPQPAPTSPPAGASKAAALEEVTT